jgi:hypothetical protein
VKIRLVPAKHGSDILQIQNKSALVMMCKAISEWEDGDPNAGAIYQQNAVRLLDKQLSDSYSTGNELDVDGGSYAWGSTPNMV